MQIAAEHRFIALDTDTALKMMQPGMYRFGLNIRTATSEDGNIETIENIKGNTLIPFTLPSGTNKCIGTLENVVGNEMFYFIWNDAGNNGIYRYSGNTNTIDRIFPADMSHPDVLNFQEDKLIHSAAYINNLLIWTDGYNPLRQINVSSAGSLPTPYLPAFISLAKFPPIYPPIVTTGDASESYMEDKSFVFIMRYVYADDQKSTWSPVSKLAITGYNGAKKKKITLDLTAGGLNEEFLDSRYNAIIKKIDVAFRDNYTDPFKLIGQFEFPTNTVEFLNNETYPVIATEETNKIADSVPRTSDTLALMQDRLFTGGNKEGYDNPDIVISNVTYPDLTESLNNRYFKSGSKYKIAIVAKGETGQGTAAITTKELTVNTPFFAGNFNTKGISFELSGTPPEWAKSVHILMTENLTSRFFLQTRVADTKRVTGYDVDGNPIFEQETTDIIGYSLWNRRNNDLPVYSGGLTKDGTPIQKRNGVIGYTFNPSFPTIIHGSVTWPDIALIYEGGKNHLGQDIIPANPGDPIGYEIVKGTDPSGQLLYEGGVYADTSSPAVYDNVIGFTKSLADVTFSYDFFREDFMIFDGGYNRYGNPVPFVGGGTSTSELYIDYTNFNINKTPYVWEEGDRISIYTKDSLDLPLSNLANYRSLKIKSATPNYLVIDWDSGYPIIEPGALVEIKKPRMGVAGTDFYYEVGLSFPIINPGTPSATYGAETGGKRTINITEGDIFFVQNKVKVPLASGSYPGTANVESMVPSNDIVPYEDWHKGIGRPYIVISDSKEAYYRTGIRFSNQYVTGSNINGLSTFDALNNKNLPIEYGPICKLQPAANYQAEGSVLLSVHSNEIVSIYIGQVTIKEAAGGQQVALSDSVIGSMNPLSRATGSVSPESIKQFNGQVYGFDLQRGLVWRYAQNGLDFISESGMRNFWYRKGQELIKQSVKVIADIDRYNNEYVITVPGDNQEMRTLTWSENINKWTSFYSFIPEYYGRLNTKLISFVNGELWVHTDNDLYNNFYGVQYKSKIKLVCNDQPHMVKILQRIEEEADDLWDCVDIATPEGQSSELIGLRNPLAPYTPPQDFWKSEGGTYFGVVMRDKNTPAGGPNPLLTGDVIRSQVFTVLMECAVTAQTTLKYVNLHYIPSMKTNLPPKRV